MKRFYLLFLFLGTVFLGGSAFAQINTGNPAYPFPQEVQYLGGDLPTSAESDDAQAAYEFWKENYVVGGCGDTRVKFDYFQGTTRGHTDGSYAVSEGIAYGMLLAAYAADKELFDGLWSYYKQFRNGNGVMHWKIRNCTVEGANGASDAELDVAMALIVASYQWQSDSYLNDAKNMIRIIRQHEIDGNLVLKPGDQFGGSNLTNPSYFSPAYYRVFKQYDPGYETYWDNVAAKGYEIIWNASDMGVVPDWCTAAGNASPEAGQYEDEGKAFIFDAVRTPMRSGLDMLWHGHPDAEEYCETFTNWAEGAHNSDAGQIGGKYGTKLMGNEGTKLADYDNNAFIGCFGVAGMGADGADSWTNSTYTHNVNTTPAHGEYFNATLKAITLFMMTGNFYLPPPDDCDGPDLGEDRSLCEGSPLELDAGVPNGTYVWKRNNEELPGETSQTLSVTTPGSYEVVATTADGCTRRDNIEIGAATIVPDFVATPGPGSITIANNSSGGISNYTYVINGGIYTDEVIGTSPNATINEVASGTYEVTLTVDNAGYGCSDEESVTKTIIIGQGEGVAIDDFNNTYEDGIVLWEPNPAYFDPLPKKYCSAEDANDPDAEEECFDLPCSQLELHAQGGDGAEYVPYGISFEGDAGPMDLTDVPFVSLKVYASETIKLGVKLAMDQVSSNSVYITIPAGTTLDTVLDFSSVTGGWDNSIGENGASTTIDAYDAVDAINFVLFEDQEDWTGTLSFDYIILGSKALPPPEFDIETDENGYTVYTANGDPKSTWEKTADACSGTATVTAESCTADEIKWYSGDTEVGAGASIELTPGTYFVELINKGGITRDTVEVVGANLSAGFEYQVEDLGKALRLTNTSTDFDSWEWSYGVTPEDAEATTWETGYNYYQEDGTYEVCIEVENDACGTTDQYCEEIEITCTAPMDAIANFESTEGSMSADTLSICPGVETTVSIDTVNNAASYGWYDIDGDMGVDTSFITTGFDVSHWLKVDAYNICDETVSDSIFVNVLNGAVAVIDSAVRAEGQTYDLYAKWSGDAPETTYEWYIGDELIGTGIHHQHTFETGGTHEVTLRVSNSCGEAEDSEDVGCDLPDVSAAEISGEPEICGGEDCIPYELTGAPDAVEYNWDLGGAGTICSGEGSELIEAQFSQSGTISVTAVNSCGESEPVTIEVVVNPAPVNNPIEGPEDVACGGTANYTIAGEPGSEFSWTAPLDANITGDGTSDVNIEFGETSGTVTVTETTAAGCVGEEQTLEVSLLGCDLVAGFTADASTVCAGEVVTFTDASEGVSSNTTYQWNFGAGADPATATGAGPHDVTYSSAGAKDVSLQITEGATAEEAKTAFVSVDPLPESVVNMTGPEAVCEGEPAVYSIDEVANATGYTWEVPSDADIISGDGTTSIEVEFASASGSVKAYPVNTCGTGLHDSINVSVEAAPAAPEVLGEESPECSSSDVVYEVATPNPSSTYRWTVPEEATIVSGEDGPSIYVNFGTVNGQVTATEITSAGCEGEPGSLPVSLQNCELAANFEADVTEVCEGTTVVFTDISTGTTDNSTYEWSFGDGADPATATGAGPHDVTYESAGTFDVSVTVTEAGETEVKNSPGYITVNPLAGDPSAIDGPDAICENESASYSIEALPNADSYSWTGPEDAHIVARGNTAEITFGTSSGQVSVTPSNRCGDGRTASVSVSVSGPPETSAIAGSTSVSCEAAGEVYSVTGSANSTYEWTVPAGAEIVSGGSTNSITVDFGTQDGEITVTETTEAGCVGTTQSESITLMGCDLIADFSASVTTACIGEEIVFSDASVETTSSTTYSWDFGAGATASSTTGSGDKTVSYSTAGPKTVTLTIVDGGVTRVEEKEAYITINDGIESLGSISGPETVCAGATETYSVSSVAGASSYDWSVPAGADMSGSGESISVTFGENGGEVSVTPQGRCGTGQPISKTITITNDVNPVVSITASPESPITPGQSVTFTATPVHGGTSPSYEWFVNGSVVATAGATYTTSDIEDGDEVTVTMTSSSSCAPGEASDAMTMDVMRAGEVFAGTSRDVCNQRTSLDADPVDCGQGTWTLVSGSGIVIDENNPKSRVTGLGSGANIFQWTVEGNCQSGSDQVTIYGTFPAVSISADRTEICEGEEIEFTATPVYGGSKPSFTWLFDGAEVATTSSPVFTTSVLTDGQNVEVSMTSSLAACENSSGATKTSDNSLKISVDEAPTAADAGDDIITTNSLITLSANTPGLGEEGEWTSSDGITITNPSRADISVDGLSEGEYEFIWTISNGICDPSSDEVIVTVGSKPSAPEEISVSGDPEDLVVDETYTFEIPENEGSDYEWEIPSGMTLVDGSELTGSNSITVRVTAPLEGNSSVSVIESNDFGSTKSSVNVNTGNAPSTPEISGIKENLAPGQIYTYSVPEDDASSYEWELSEGMSFVGSNTGSSVEVAVDDYFTGGQITVTQTNTHGSTSSTANVRTVPDPDSGSDPQPDPDDPNGIFDIAGGDRLSVSPNPFENSTSLHIESSLQTDVNVTITNSKGVVLERSVFRTNQNIRVGDELNAGVYIVKMEYQGRIKFFKIIKM